MTKKMNICKPLLLVFIPYRTEGNMISIFNIKLVFYYIQNSLFNFNKTDQCTQEYILSIKKRKLI